MSGLFLRRRQEISNCDYCNELAVGTITSGGVGIKHSSVHTCKKHGEIILKIVRGGCFDFEKKIREELAKELLKRAGL